MKKEKKRKIALITGVILLLVITALHIPKYNITLYIGSDTAIGNLIGQDTNDFSDPAADIKVEIGGNVVYQVDSVDFTRYLYTRKDISLRAGFHCVKISSESMGIHIEHICYTLFDYYILIELFPPSTGETDSSASVRTGFMPFNFI